jgi:uncharacterized protein
VNPSPSPARHNEQVRLLGFGRRSSDEYPPVPLSPVVAEAMRRARVEIDELVRRGAVSRRDVLRSAAASAAVLSALAACTNEERAATGGGSSTGSSRSPASMVPTTSAPGGTFEVPGSRTTSSGSSSSSATVIDPEAATTVLDTPLASGTIVDVQLHFLDEQRNAGGGFGAGFPQASCERGSVAACFSLEAFLDLVFGQSQTGVGVLSGLPMADRSSALAIDVMEQARLALAGSELGSGAGARSSRRLLLQAPVFPATGEIGAVLEAMTQDAATYPVAAWKTYTHAPDVFRLDDERGAAMLAHAVELGRPIVAVHKGLSGEDPAASPVDVGPAARDHPRARIVVYHSGWETSSPEGPYDQSRPLGEQRGVDRLIGSVAAAGIGPGDNVYAELGSTWFNLAHDLDAAAHVLGKLLVHLGPERILWGTDSIWYGSPQPQIDAFRTFSISEEYQERFGYPALTDAVKARILGGNAVELYGL